MNEESEHRIPAASIGKTDLEALSSTHPESASEIARLRDLMNQGKESEEEFLRLCQLLFDVGSNEDSEILLRRNLTSAEGESLYKRLFGAVKQDEFDAAIRAFENQFGLKLTTLEQNDFLITTFVSETGASNPGEFHLLSKPCEIKISYVERDKIEADICLRELTDVIAESYKFHFLLFVHGVWEHGDPMDA